MGKFALLIGVSNYAGENLSNLPAATKDATALKEILEDPQLGNFDEVTVLSDPSRDEMARTIAVWIDKKQSDDLALLFFSGHGLKDSLGSLYFAASDTDRELVDATGIAANYVRSRFQRSKPQRKVIILDCCFAGAFGRFNLKDGGDLNLGEKLKAQGTVILAATDSLSYALEEKEQETNLSIYTRYLVEGIQKGTADPNNSGYIIASELHKFVNRKVKEAAPTMQPEIFAPEGEGFDIQISFAPREKPELRYRKRVEERVKSAGEIAPPGRRMLERRRKEYGLSEEIAKSIETEVLKPILEHKRKLADYRTTLAECIEDGKIIKDSYIDELDHYQKDLGLRDGDVQPIQRELTGDVLAVGESDVAVVYNRTKTPKQPLILLDPEIASQWDVRPEDIVVWKRTSLDEIDANKLASYSTMWPDVKCITADSIFLPELKFIDDRENAIPGGLMPEATQPIVFAEERITPLIPLTSLLLEYFTPEDLVSYLEFRPISGDEPQVEVSLALPLASKSGSSEARVYRLTRLYLLRQDNALAVPPVLELWPNFRAPNWKVYYAFFFDLAAGDLTFYVRLPDGVETENFNDDQNGNYSFTQLEAFPSFVECLNSSNRAIGLILLEQPPILDCKVTRQIGIDFNTHFTNVFMGRRGKAEPLPFSEGLVLALTDSPLDSRFPTLFEYFIPDRFLPVDKPLPLSTVLTLRGSNRPEGQESRPILDGRIYIPSLLSSLDEDFIETELTWEEDRLPYTKLFLKNLVLLILASMLKQGVRKMEWIIACSFNLSVQQQMLCENTWREVIEEVLALTGLDQSQHNSTVTINFVDSNLAIGQYFSSVERADLIYSTCVHIDRNTSALSIWQNNKIIYKDCFDFAERDILSNILFLDPALVASFFRKEASHWMNLRSSEFYRKLDVLLRWEGEEWLRTEKLKLADEKKMQGLVRLMALGFGGLYYYTGIVLNVLQREALYERDYATPVYLGGNGSKLLHWIDVTGHFTQNSEVDLLLSRILSRGSGMEDTEESTQLSLQPEDDIAYGLLLDSSRHERIDRSAQNLLISGETCVINRVSCSWQQPMNIAQGINSFTIPSLDNLNIFIYEFHKALIELRIEGIRSLPGYKLSMEIHDNAKLWRGVRRSLDRILQETRIEGDVNNIRMQPAFILGLKALLQHLASEWSKAP